MAAKSMKTTVHRIVKRFVIVNRNEEGNNNSALLQSWAADLEDFLFRMTNSISKNIKDEFNKAL